MRENHTSKTKEIYEYPSDKPLTSYQKVGVVIGKIAWVGFIFMALIQVLYQFLNSQRGFISATLLTVACIWMLCETYDIATKNYDWKK